MRHKESQEPKQEHAEEKKESVGEKADPVREHTFPRDEPCREDSLTGEELRRQLADLQREKDELFARLQRVSADYANFQKRVPKQVADTIAYEKEKIIRTLLPALDNFEHTFQKAHSAESVDALVKGVRIIYDQILDILKSHGMEQINALGQKFDPSLHEAVLPKAESKEADNIVLEEFQKGYKLNGRVIRPSRVVVNKLTTEQPTQQPESEPKGQATNHDERETDAME